MAMDWTTTVQDPEGQGLSLYNTVYTGFRDHPASYPMENGDSFPWDKVEAI
jgi:hypothetical protein